jgi:UDP-N-acetylglucosamine 2-epimerase (non-hydrolysing)
LNPGRIVVVGNPIVDVLERAYFSQRDRYEAMATPAFFRARGLTRGDYYLLTCHRRENVHSRAALETVLALVAAAGRPVYFPASYRTQRQMKAHALSAPANAIVVDPIGYQEMLCLLVNSAGVFTDSGTVVEEACILQVPSVQMRRATERPQVYEVGASVKFDPSEAARYPAGEVMRKLQLLRGRSWQHPFGDGRSSERIALDLHERLRNGTLASHRPEQYQVPVASSFRDDDLGQAGT